MKDRWFYVSLFGFTIGVFLRSLFSINFYIPCFVFFVSFILFFVGSVVVNQSEKRNILYLSLFLVTFSFGVIRFDVSDYKPIRFLNDETVATIKVVVIDEPDVREDHSNLTVKIESVETSTEEKIKGNILVTTDRYTPYQYGDELLITGKIKNPKNISGVSGTDTNSNGRYFNYSAYLAKDGIYYQMFRPTIEKVSEHKGNKIKETLFTIKHLFLENINRVVNEPESSLLSGLVVGAKQSLGKKLLEDFRTAGVIHVVVLSGYNLTIVAKSLMKSFEFLPRIISLSIGGIGIILFAIMTGGSATIVRASIMSLLVLLAQGTRRDYDITRALLLAGFFMIMQNPHILVFDPSFQLSFLATIALIFLAPNIQKYFTWVPEKFGFQELAVSTIATQLFVLPFLLYSMGTFSLVALPVNLLILPLIPVTMFLGFIVGMFGFISMIISLPFAFLTHLFLWYELWVVEIFAELPFASFSVSVFPFWLMGVLYLGFLFFFLSKSKTAK